MRRVGPGSACAALLALAATGGCDSALSPMGAPAVGGAHASATPWPYWPQRMRIHPLSRLVLEGEGRSVIEVRIEFRDPDGIPTRSIGALTIDLLDADAARQPMLEWEAAVVRPDANREHYDDVTRTYLFRLDVPAERLPAHPLVRVRFESVDGLLFEDVAPIAGVE